MVTTDMSSKLLKRMAQATFGRYKCSKRGAYEPVFSMLKSVVRLGSGQSIKLRLIFINSLRKNGKRRSCDVIGIIRDAKFFSCKDHSDK